MNCYQFKAGSGTASRLVRYAGTTYAAGVFVQANFGTREELTLAGLPLGQLLADDNPMASRRSAGPGGRPDDPLSAGPAGQPARSRPRARARSSRWSLPTRPCSRSSALRSPAG